MALLNLQDRRVEVTSLCMVLAILGSLSIVMVATDPRVATTSLNNPAALEALNTGDTAWMLVSCGLVLIMTPGVAFFYGKITGETAEHPSIDVNCDVWALDISCTCLV